MIEVKATEMEIKRKNVIQTVGIDKCKTGAIGETDSFSLCATPDKDSLFTTWGHACSGSGACACASTMLVDRDVCATFSFVKPVKIGAIYYVFTTASQ